MDPRTLTGDFKEFLNLLNAHEVDYLVIGGHAVAFHGYPRATNDLDVWIAVPFIGLEDLKTNKRASGRNKDLADLDELP